MHKTLAIVGLMLGLSSAAMADQYCGPGYAYRNGYCYWVGTGPGYVAGTAVGTAGNVATGAVGTAGNVATDAVGTAGNVATGAVGTAGNIVGGTLGVITGR
jgi:hypothetical protein